MTRRTLVLAGAFYAVMAAVAGVWAGVAGREVGLARLPGREAWGFGAAVAVGAAAGLAIVGATALAHAVSPRARELSERIAGLLGPLAPGDVLLLAAWSGVAEEALFRGAMLPSIGLVPSSLVFGMLHFLGPRYVSYAVFASAAGLAFGALFQWTGHLAAPITAHVVVNAINLSLIERSRRSGHG